MLSVLSLLPACAGTGGRIPVQDLLVVGQLGALDNVNELVGESGEHNRALSRLLFLPLLEELPDFSVGPPTYAPLLAESWERSEDRTVLTFHLRPGLEWSDGEPLTAEDVHFTWLAQVSPDIAWPLAPSSNLLDVEVVDAVTVRFRFARPSANQLSDAVAGGVLPRHRWSELPFASWRSNPHWFAENLAVSGPYTVSDWAPPESVELTANPRYHRPERPRLHRVVLRFTKSDVALLAMLRAGEAGLVAPVPARDRARLDREPGVETLDYPTRQVTFLSWNTRRPQFAEASVRRALGLAIDRQEIVDTIWFGGATVGSTPIPSSVWARDPTVSSLPFDAAEARELLAAAGWRDHDGDGVLDRDGVPFRFELLTNSGNEQRWDALQMIRADLAEVGIDAVPRRLELLAVGAALIESRYDAALTAFGIDTHLDLGFAFHSRSIEAGYNYGGYRSEAVDRLLDTIATAEDRRSVLAELHELQRALYRDQPVLFLWEPRGVVAFADTLVPVRPNELGVLRNLEDWEWR
ncbi:MAG TPA: ABC transporter substrate-binding protein [Thermoanaerobaculia bacterium]|nr:ABC transporter substrate-binding protein [Thermoanaerobaculia bacterium]